MADYAADNPVYAGSVLEAAHGPYPAADFSESPFYGIGGAHLVLMRLRAPRKAQEFIQVCLQATNPGLSGTLPLGPLLKAGYRLPPGSGLVYTLSPFKAGLLHPSG